MKKILLLISVIFLVGCSSDTELVNALAENGILKNQIAEKDNTIDDLENQVQILNESLDTLQAGYDELKAKTSAADGEAESASGMYLCDVLIENMKYESNLSATAILEGWFAQQPQTRLIQGTYSTAFWTGIKSTIHTIRYISDDTGLTATHSFMIFFEEGGWQEGVLSMNDQCWLDFPG